MKIEKRIKNRDKKRTNNKNNDKKKTETKMLEVSTLPDPYYNIISYAHIKTHVMCCSQNMTLDGFRVFLYFQVDIIVTDKIQNE